MKDVNLNLLVDVVERLVPLLDEIVLVGGCATGLLVTDPGASSVRRTFDVDVIAEIISYSEFVAFSEHSTKLGLLLDTSGGTSVPMDLRRIKTGCNADSNNSICTANAGEIGSTSISSRQIQFGLKLSW